MTCRGLGKSLVGYVTPAVGADVVDLDRIRARVGGGAARVHDPGRRTSCSTRSRSPRTARSTGAALPEPEIEVGDRIPRTRHRHRTASRRTVRRAARPRAGRCRRLVLRTRRSLAAGHQAGRRDPRGVWCRDRRARRLRAGHGRGSWPSRSTQLSHPVSASVGPGDRAYPARRAAAAVGRRSCDSWFAVPGRRSQPGQQHSVRRQADRAHGTSMH